MTARDDLRAVCRAAERLLAELEAQPASMRHWTDATCSGCAAADERARRAEAERDVALAESRGLAHDVIDRVRERYEARKERDAARSMLEAVRTKLRLLMEVKR